VGRPGSVAARVTYLLEPKNWLIVTVVGVGAHADGLAGAGWGLLAAFFAAVLPTVFIAYGIRRGRWEDRNVGDRRPRLVVLAFIIASVATGLILLAVLGAPALLTGYLVFMLASVAALAAVTLVWKISIHCAVAAGSVTILAFAYGPLVLGGYLLVGLLGWSRVTVRDHTVPQVVGGSILGAAAAFLAYAVIIRLVVLAAGLLWSRRRERRITWAEADRGHGRGLKASLALSHRPHGERDSGAGQGCGQFAGAAEQPGQGDRVHVVVITDDLAVAYPDNAERSVPVGLPGRLRPAVVGDLGDHDLGVVGLPDHGLDTLHDQQVAGPAPAPEVIPDSLPAAQLGGLPGQAERVGEDSVLGEQVGEVHAFPGDHAANLLGDFARATGHDSCLPIIGTVTPLKLYGTLAPVSNHD
jgi:hypothetical protein